MRILPTGGITFNGDTAAANASDDYEEGTWTPSIRFSAGNTGMTSTTAVGTYTKVGNIVTAAFRINLSSKGTSTGVGEVYGFPFSSANILGNNSGAAGYISQVITSGQIMLNLWNGTPVASFYTRADNGVSTNVDHSSFGNFTYLAMSVTYQTA